MHKKRKTFGFTQAHEKVCDEMKQRKKRRMLLKEGRKPFIMPIQKTCGNDLHELQGNDYGYSEGTICLVNG